jgi:hypothetical protein
MSWSVVRFGKHKGKTLPQIIFNDPDWFFWAVEKDAFRNKGPLAREADDLARKATAIRIPGAEGGERLAEYIIHPPTGKFSYMDIIPAGQDVHEGSSPTFRRPVMDLSVPRKIAPFDKLGSRTLLSRVKLELFGSKSARMTQKRCEEFFDNPDNFLFPT